MMTLNDLNVDTARYILENAAACWANFMVSFHRQAHTGGEADRNLLGDLVQEFMMFLSRACRRQDKGQAVLSALCIATKCSRWTGEIDDRVHTSGGGPLIGNRDTDFAYCSQFTGIFADLHTSCVIDWPPQLGIGHLDFQGQPRRRPMRPAAP